MRAQPYSRLPARPVRILGIFLLATSALPSLLPAGEAAKTPAWVAPSASEGRLVYEKSCSACHGEAGDGQGPAAAYLEPRPRDFTSGTFKFRGTPNGELPTDADLLRIVEEGIPGTSMPAWKRVLTARERVDVVAYLKTFAEDFKDAAPAPLDVPEPPESTPAAVSEGRMVYMLMECWACHGGRGKGDGKSGRTLEDDWGRKIRPWDLTRARYKAGNDSKSLYRTFSTGLNGTPMPAYALDGFLIPGDAQVDPAKYAEAYGADEIAQLKAWLEGQPPAAELDRLPAEQKQALGERRKWALVHYIRSLVRKPGLFHPLFVADPEVTP